MKTGRLEAFTDAVIAIIMTIMVLELIPAEHTEINTAYLHHQLPTFVAMVLSFVSIAIYWNNHHHLMNSAERINGKTLWLNMNLLFWIALIPITTVMIGDHYDEDLSVFIYGVNMVMCAISYFLLQKNLRSLHRAEDPINTQIGKDKKGRVTLIIYLIGMALIPVSTWLTIVAYVIVLAIWFKPDSRLENSETTKA